VLPKASECSEKCFGVEYFIIVVAASSRQSLIVSQRARKCRIELKVARCHQKQPQMRLQLSIDEAEHSSLLQLVVALRIGFVVNAMISSPAGSCARLCFRSNSLSFRFAQLQLAADEVSISRENKLKFHVLCPIAIDRHNGRRKSSALNRAFPRWSWHNHGHHESSSYAANVLQLGRNIYASSWADMISLNIVPYTTVVLGCCYRRHEWAGPRTFAKSTKQTAWI
jgi:hypothetical protein